MVNDVQAGLLTLQLGFVKAFLLKGTSKHVLVDTGTKGQLPAIAFWAASREDSIASIRRVLDLKPSIILTSHGGPYRPEALAVLVR